MRKIERTLREAREFYHDFLRQQVLFFGVRLNEDVERGERQGKKKKELKRERTIINVVGQEEEEKIDERDVVKNKTTMTTM